MKRKLITLTLAALSLMASSQKPAIPRDEQIEKKVETLLSKMTLDEKVGQMLELNLDVIGKMQAINPKIERSKIKQKFLEYGRSEERRVGKECRSRWSADH